ncbi:unnamed protein product [Meganyctiphanes norvegica]|uniref:C2H2-type domain-containing protein n=1 Tax=Meganyctiphanes norvegica TaxID=48144 RepID=A0AAV2RDZ0_MEGNR
MEKTNQFDCTHCKCKYKIFSSLQRHIKSKHKGKTVNKTNNDNIQYEEKALVRHETFECHYCNMKFKYQNSLKKHIRKYHQNNMVDSEIVPNVCNICGKKFSNETTTKLHIKRYHYESNILHECNICDKVFTLKKSLKRHNKCIHPDLYSKAQSHDQKLHNGRNDEENYNVEVNIVKSNEPELITIVIENDKSYVIDTEPIKCQECDIIFKTKQNLKGHMKYIHSLQSAPRSKTIKCSLYNCNQLFVTIKELRTHYMGLEVNGGHNYTIEKEELVFSNFSEFWQWKGDQEEQGDSRYYKHRSVGKNKDGSYRITYHCSRSGNYHRCTGKRKRDTKSQGTSKLNHYCPSTMDIFGDKNGQVQCTYYKKHVGHGTDEEDVMYVTMHERDKQYIKEKTRDGVDIARVKLDLNRKGGRATWINRKDVNNHINLEGLNTSHSFSSSDPISVHKWVQELTDDCVLHYEPQTADKKSFNLVLFFKPQQTYHVDQQAAKRFNKNIFCMDSTHGIGVGDFKLITLLHISDTGNGMPVLFCITSHDTGKVVENMLQVFKDKVGEIEADVFISDDARHYRNSWTKINGRAKKYITCTWHMKTAVIENARKKIPKQEDVTTIKDMFMNLIDEVNVEKFKTSKTNFLNYLKQNKFTEFLKYFEDTWLKRNDVEEREKLWAKCYQDGIRINVNNHIENWHRQIKKVKFNKVTIKRVDKVIYACQVLVIDKLRIRYENIYRGRTNHKKTGFAARCKNGKILKVDQKDDKFEVSRVNGPIHIVCVNDINCKCLEKCSQCGVCDHQYKCDCKDNERNMCKHVHAVGHKTFVKNQPKNIDSSILEEAEHLNEFLVHDKDDGSKLLEVSERVSVKISNMLNTDASLSSARIKEIENHLKRAEVLIDLDNVHNDGKYFIPESKQVQKNVVLSNDPANKKIKLQDKFRSNKKKKKDATREKMNPLPAQAAEIDKILHTLPPDGQTELLDIMSIFKNEHSYA